MGGKFELENDKWVTHKYHRHHDINVSAATFGPTAPSPTTLGVARGLGFDADAEALHFVVEVPDEWIGSENMEIKVSWAPDSAPSDTNKVKLDIEYVSLAEGEDIDSATTTTSTTTYTQSGAGTQGEFIATSIVLAYNDANNPLTIGDTLYCKFSRDVTGEAGDSFAGQAVVFKFELEYGANKLGTH